MNGSLLANGLMIAESIFCIVALACILLRKQGRDYKYLCALLGVHGITSPFLTLLWVYGGHGIEKHLAYRIYFYSYWSLFALESVLGMLLINSIFNLAMAPLQGLKKLGKLIFRWATGISIAIAFASALTPHLTEVSFITNFVSELQRAQSVLTLCLLLFVCFAIRPMGLTYSSRVFGASLGLGIIATTNLVEAALMVHARRMYNDMSTVKEIAICCALVLWTAYFALPEPKRRIIVLPTTSPFLRWNQISQVLGAEPGFVAVGGVPPELFAPAELEVMRRASLKMKDQPVTLMSQQSA